MIGNGTHTAKFPAAGRHQGSQQSWTGSIGEGGQHCRIGGGDGIQRGAIKIERVEHHVVKCKDCALRKRRLEHSFAPGRPGQAEAWLEIISIRRTSRNQAITLETGAIRALDLSTFESSSFK